MLAGGGQRVHGKRHFLHQVAGREPAGGVRARRAGEEGAEIDGGGQDEPLVVVRVVAEHLDAAGGIGHDRGFPVVLLPELLEQGAVQLMVQHREYP